MVEVVEALEVGVGVGVDVLVVRMSIWLRRVRARRSRVLISWRMAWWAAEEGVLVKVVGDGRLALCLLRKGVFVAAAGV